MFTLYGRNFVKFFNFTVQYVGNVVIVVSVDIVGRGFVLAKLAILAMGAAAANFAKKLTILPSKASHNDFDFANFLPNLPSIGSF